VSLYPLGKNSGTHLIIGLVGPGVVLDVSEKINFAVDWSRASDCPASSLITTLTELPRRVRRIYIYISIYLFIYLYLYIHIHTHTVFYVLLPTCKLQTEQKICLDFLDVLWCVN
jgi:hypothetical protein